MSERIHVSAFVADLRLRREKTKGRFVYYDADAAVYRAQRQRREALQATGREPTPAEAIALLVETIKHPA